MLALLALTWLAGAAFAHEPYLLVTANDDGTFTAEAGYSDGLSVEGLTLRVRDRATGELLAEHRFPADGFLTLPRPAAPYRVEFDGGPGHRILKPGPEPEPEPAPTPAAAVPAQTDAAPAPAPVAAAALVPASQPAVPAPVRPEAASVAATVTGETTRIALVVGIFFLFGALAFALGFSAGRRSS